MTLDSLGRELGIYGGTFVIALIGAVVPIANVELWLVAVTVTLVTPAPLPALVLLAAAGSMLGKVPLYQAAHGVAGVPQRYRERVERARARVAGWRKQRLLVLWASATIGLPPFYLVALLAGALEVRLRTFLAVGLVGRTLRFAVIVGLAWWGADL